MWLTDVYDKVVVDVLLNSYAYVKNLTFSKQGFNMKFYTFKVANPQIQLTPSKRLVSALVDGMHVQIYK